MEEDSQPKLFRYGTYYAVPDKGGRYGILRILTIDNAAIHYSVFAETFEGFPMEEQIRHLTPAIAHVPQALSAVFSHDYTPIFHRDLEISDLEGLRRYWKQMGAGDDDIESEARAVRDFSLSGNQIGFFKDGTARVIERGEQNP